MLAVCLGLFVFSGGYASAQSTSQNQDGSKDLPETSQTSNVAAQQQEAAPQAAETSKESEAETPAEENQELTVEPKQESDSEVADPEEKKKHLEWMFLLNPSGGYLQNTAKFHFKIPHQGGFQEREASISDDGWGMGMTFMGFYKWLSIVNVTYLFPEVNESFLWGNILAVSGTVPTGTFVEPYFGLSFVYHSTNTDYKNLKITERDELAGKTAIAYANLDKISVDVDVFAPLPKIGAKFKIPIQHWYVQPWYCPMYEKAFTHARSSGGHVDVYEEGYEDSRPPDVSADIPVFDTKGDKDYFSNLVGTDIFLDFHYFLQLRSRIYYNVDYNNWTVRTIGSFLFSKYVGMTLYFEYSEKITVNNMYFLAGPSFLFMPSGFFDNMKHGKK